MDSISGNVLITGGSGSLGTALLERGTREGWDWRPTVFSRDEVKQSVVRERFKSVRFVLGDVRDASVLSDALRGQDTVVHAGALKRVPEAEQMPDAYIHANVEGSLNVAREAARAGVHRVIGISTDKACAPTGVYGATKLLMERVFQSAVTPWGPRFTLVRYGNVLGSRGSVIPTFRRQAEAGGPLTLTDPEMTRFWITMDDALDLIVRGLQIPAGQILVPRSRASSMAVLAEAVAPGVETLTVGTRGGERKHETLINELEEVASESDRYFHLAAPHRQALPSYSWGGSRTVYSSHNARQFEALELATVIHAMEAGERVTTL